MCVQLNCSYMLQKEITEGTLLSRNCLQYLNPPDYIPTGKVVLNHKKYSRY